LTFLELWRSGWRNGMQNPGALSLWHKSKALQIL
jgi:hypothetical protein